MSERELLSVINHEELKACIWLRCSDGSIHIVEEEVAMFSPVIRQIVKSGTELSKNYAIALPERVSSAILMSILDYCRFHRVPGRSDKERKSFDVMFISRVRRRHKEKMCELTSAADYLQLKPLFDLTSRGHAQIEGNTSEETRDIFHLPHGLTKEEKLGPLKNINDDPKIRLLNQLYAKKRQERQEREKLKDIQVQLEQKDDRILTGGVVERLPAMLQKSTSTAPDFNKATLDFNSTTTTDFDCDGTCYLTDRRLETWDDPNHRDSEFTRDELRQACLDAIKRQSSLKTRPPTRNERLKRRDEHDRNSLMIALQAYAKKNNMQSTHLEFVEVKQRNLIDEHGKGYLHFNFLVKEIDGKLTNFFAELHPDLKNENGVYLCMPLEEKDVHPSKGHEQAHCYGCKDRAKDLVHPSGGGFLGGHEEVGSPFMGFESDDERDAESEDNADD